MLIISSNKWSTKKTTKHLIGGLHRLSRIRLGEDLGKSLFQNPRTGAGKVEIHTSLNLQKPLRQLQHPRLGGSPWCVRQNVTADTQCRVWASVMASEIPALIPMAQDFQTEYY